MSKFVGVYRELASFTELLNTQVELMLVERLHHNWLKVINRPALLLTDESWRSCLSCTLVTPI